MKLDIGRELFPRPRRLYDPIRVKAESLHGVSQGIPIAAEARCHFVGCQRASHGTGAEKADVSAFFIGKGDDFEPSFH